MVNEVSKVNEVSTLMMGVHVCSLFIYENIALDLQHKNPNVQNEVLKFKINVFVSLPESVKGTFF